MPGSCLIPRPLGEFGAAGSGEEPGAAVGVRGPGRAACVEALQSRLCLVEEHIPSCSCALISYATLNQLLSSMLFEEQCYFLNWRLDSRDLKTSGLAIPE